MNQYRLRSSEWILTGSLLLLLLSLLAIAKIKAAQFGEPQERKIITLDVSIDGHVKKPGVYSIPRGTLIGEALKKAHPKKFADLRSIPL
ncbi:MAG TPA: SLBB domain-containing protein, partial [Chlamydiales bacterium]|nr:SLBB domain-containing protein [Chlamydiales bacterium]